MVGRHTCPLPMWSNSWVERDAWIPEFNERSEEILPSAIDLEPRISYAIADGWSKFLVAMLPTISGSDRAQARVAFQSRGPLGVCRSI